MHRLRAVQGGSAVAAADVLRQLDHEVRAWERRADIAAIKAEIARNRAAAMMEYIKVAGMVVGVIGRLAAVAGKAAGAAMLFGLLRGSGVG